MTTASNDRTGGGATPISFGAAFRVWLRIGVGIASKRIGSRVDLIAVVDAIAIGVSDDRRRHSFVRLNIVRKAVAIRIAVGWIRS